MAIGAIFLAISPFVLAIASVLGVRLLLKKLYGKPREMSELEEKEKNIINVCLEQAKAFRRKEKDGKGSVTKAWPSQLDELSYT